MIALAGRKLNCRLGIGAQHALYRETGNFYNCLTKFPGVLFDRYGYIIFEAREQYETARSCELESVLMCPAA
jgi:5-methylcytosine-specific restriction enzyme A